MIKVIDTIKEINIESILRCIKRNTVLQIIGRIILLDRISNLDKRNHLDMISSIDTINNLNRIIIMRSSLKGGDNPMNRTNITASNENCIDVIFVISIYCLHSLLLIIYVIFINFKFF